MWEVAQPLSEAPECLVLHLSPARVKGTPLLPRAISPSEQWKWVLTLRIYT